MNTPNEVVWWARDHICPLCRNSLKQDAEDIFTDITYKDNSGSLRSLIEPYMSDLSCNIDDAIFPSEVDHYWVALEYSDPKELHIEREELLFEHNDMKFEILIRDSHTNISWCSVYDDTDNWRYIDLNELVFDFGPEYTKEKFLKTLDMLMILQ